MRKYIISLLVTLIAVVFTGSANAALLMELRPQDYDGNKWSIYQGALKDANSSLAYFKPDGTPQYVQNVAGTKHSGIGMNNSCWDSCQGLAGPIAPASITGDTPKTIEVWTFNPSLQTEETLVELSYRVSTNGGQFAFENGGNWALHGGGTGDVNNWNSANRSNRWVHLVVTYASGVATFYVDGEVTATKNQVYNIAAGNCIAIGSQRTSANTTSNSPTGLNNQGYTGYIGNVRIYDAALSQAEVRSRFGLGINGGEADATTYTVSGQVSDGTSGIAGAMVYFSTSASASLNPVYVATTDSNGNYSQSLPEGAWYVAAGKARYTANPTADKQVVLTSDTDGQNFTLTYVTTPTKLIDMDASQLAGNDNDPISAWINAGTLGGSFGLDGTDQSSRPVLGTQFGKRCVTFDGSNDRLKLLNGANAINAPAAITGNSDWTVCGWYLNPQLGSTECYLSWANSADQVGARCGFMYGSHNGDGAVMHGNSPWMNSNMAILPLPTAGLWHHVTVTFDGTVEKIYVDGAANQTENKNLKIAAGEPILMGAWYAALGASPGTYYSGSIASLTVYDQVLTPAEIAALGTQQLYTISGTVKDNANQPISGAMVYFSVSANASVSQVLSTTTDSNGNYSQQVPAGNWYISVMKSRYTPNPAADVVAAVTNANVSGKDFTLTPDLTLHKLIDLDASSLSTGALSSWPNAGSVGGSFAQDGTDPATNPSVTSVAGKKAVTFDGSNDRLKASFTAPAGITSGSDWTVSAMVYNPSIADQEAYLCWAQLGTTSRAAEFCYGLSYSVGNASNKLGWGTVPSAGAWHHVAVVYDGTSEKVYVDGVFSVQSSTLYLNIWPGQPVFVGSAYDNASGSTKSQWFSGSVASLQVYDEALTQSEIRAIATVNISGTVTGPNGNPVVGAVVGFKSTSKTTAGLAVSAAADSDVYVVTDGAGNYSTPLLKDNSYYVAAWKDGYAPCEDVPVTANVAKAVNLSIVSEAGANLALGRTKEDDRLYASPTGLGSNSVNNGFDGNVGTYFSWNTSSQKDLVIDVTKSDGTADSIDGITLITNSYRVNDWEIWVESNADPIVGGTRNTSAAWTKVYQSVGATGGYYRSNNGGQVIDPVKLAATNARGVWIKIINGSSSDTRPLEVMVHSSGGPVSIGSCRSKDDGAYVVLSGKSVTWAPRDGNGNRITNYFYAEDLGRTAGIRVQDPSGKLDTLKVSDLVSIAGTITTDPDTNERYINASIVPSGDAGSGVAPFAMTTKTVQTDPKVVGQLVAVAGKVKEVASDGSWFMISDGYIATKVYVQGIQLPTNLAAVDDMITVIGVVGKEETVNGIKSVIRLLNYDKPAGEPGEFTFFSVSDIHYGAGIAYDTNKILIDVMNSLPGTAYPASLGGNVQTPRGVIEIGDIADGGTDVQFDMFTADFGVNGECRLRYPVFEGLGNHDGRVGNPVSLRIQARNPLRRGLTGVSANGMHYSWDWGGVHFVQLNMVPTEVSEANPSNALVGNPTYALQFVKDDLAANVGNSGRPVFIAHHYGFEEFSSGWWTQNERTLYYNAIKNYNVIGIAHGHKHSPAKYQWDGSTFGPSLLNGIDIYQDGSGYNIEDACPGGFYVYRVRNNQLSYAQRYYNPTTHLWQWGMSGTKTITNPASLPFAN